MQPVPSMQEPSVLTGAITEQLAALLREQWGIMLWSARLKEDRMKLKMETSRPVDEIALLTWLNDWAAQNLGPGLEISIKFKPMAACCGSGCKGCLLGKPRA